MLWLAFGLLSAFFAGIVAILAKIGLSGSFSSNLTTLIRSVIITAFAWIWLICLNLQGEIYSLSSKNWLFLLLSGFATGASWLCYFKALSLGEVNKVTPIDKLSTPLGIVFALLILGESFNTLKWLAVVLIGFGVILMTKGSTQINSINLKLKSTNKFKNFRVLECLKRNLWLIYALLSAIFAGLTAILAKISLDGINPDIATAIRCVVIVLMAWIVILYGSERFKFIELFRYKKELLFIVLSAFATIASWLCYFRALNLGNASAVIAIDKLSIVFTVVFSYILFKERLSKNGIYGLLMIVAANIILAFG
ncbi:MAG: EamA family transporter [Campylobacter sp.]|nr:EamA family transporter [Campylobacter sp.]